MNQQLRPEDITDRTCPFVGWWWAVFVPKHLEPMQRRIGTTALWSTVARVIGVKRESVMAWAGEHSDGALHLPHHYQMHKLCEGFGLTPEQQDEAWGVWLRAIRMRCSSGYIRRAQIGLRAGEVKR